MCILNIDILKLGNPKIEFENIKYNNDFMKTSFHKILLFD
jgi:hypothetical protein